MIYLDSSCLLKLFLDEPESAAVRIAVSKEDEVIVSTLTRLETQIQLKSGWLGGNYGKSRYLAFMDELDALLKSAPFLFVDLGGNVFSTAIRQDWKAGPFHLRTLDRLHLASMQELNVRRLITNDANQSAAATALGFEVVMPR